MLSQAIIEFAKKHPLEGYRRLTYMMLDAGIAAVSPSTTFRVLRDAKLLQNQHSTPSHNPARGKGFNQPSAPHKHWHTDFSYIKIRGVFYYLCCVLDGYSRAILAWDIRERMTEADAEIVIQRAKEAHPEARPRIITDCGSQYKSKEFRDFITYCQATHATTAPYYPQSNGKIERFHKTIKHHAIAPSTPLTLENAKEIAHDFIQYYNQTRLHSAISYIAPNDHLTGKTPKISAQREKFLDKQKKHRKLTNKHAQNLAA